MTTSITAYGSAETLAPVWATRFNEDLAADTRTERRLFIKGWIVIAIIAALIALRVWVA